MNRLAISYEITTTSSRLVALYLYNISPYGIHVGALHYPHVRRGGCLPWSTLPLGNHGAWTSPEIDRMELSWCYGNLVVLKDDTYNAHCRLVDNAGPILQCCSFATMSGPLSHVFSLFAPCKVRVFHVYSKRLSCGSCSLSPLESTSADFNVGTLRIEECKPIVDFPSLWIAMCH